MGAITVYKISNGGTDEENRRFGMQDLGQLIRGNTELPSGTKKPAGKNDFYAEGLEKALKDIVKSGMPNYHYEVYYKAHGTTGKGLIIPEESSISRSSFNITCELYDKRGAGMTKQADLKLQVREDSHQSAGGKKYFMDVVFPEDIDNNKYDYLDEGADDILALAPASNQAKNYMIALKFLSRCA
jgi:hypothetical protein